MKKIYLTIAIIGLMLGFSVNAMAQKNSQGIKPRPQKSGKRLVGSDGGVSDLRRSKITNDPAYIAGETRLRRNATGNRGSYPGDYDGGLRNRSGAGGHSSSTAVTSSVYHLNDGLPGVSRKQNRGIIHDGVCVETEEVKRRNRKKLQTKTVDKVETIPVGHHQVKP